MKLKEREREREKGDKKINFDTITFPNWRVLTVFCGRGVVHLSLSLLSTKKGNPPALFRRQARTHDGLHHIDAVGVSVCFAATTPDALATMAT